MDLKKRVPIILLGAAVLLLLYVASLRNYLLFHSLAEIFSVIISFSIFILAWNARRLMENDSLLFLGIAYFFVGTFDLVHTLAYQGMGVFEDTGGDVPTQLWVAARYVESISLLIAPVFVVRKLRVNLILPVYSVAAGLVLASIFYWHIFPVCFVEGQGLTLFKKTSEYVICGILVGAVMTFTRMRAKFDPGVLRLIVASIAVTIASEFSFTLYVNTYGLSNLIGHYLKIVSFYLIYKALIATGLRRPYNLLFREIKAREEALRESENKFRSLAENAPNIIASMDSCMRILYANPAILSLTEKPPSGLVGKTPVQAGLASALCEFLEGEGSLACKTGLVKTSDLEISTASGNRCFSVTFVPEASPRKLGNVLVVATDVTALREAEKITRRDKEALESLVAKRSEELLRAQRQLAEAERLSGIGTLAAAVAHELRNPLGVIKTAVYNIRRKTKEKALDKNLANMEKKIVESDLIISNLLRYSRIRPPRLEAANLFAILMEALEGAAEAFAGNTATVSADIESLRDKAVKADAVQIKEVFVNLLNNAYQAIPPTGGQIEVSCTYHPGREVSVSIRDNGCGIPPGVLEKIFEPFFTTKSRGTGLGLVICKEIIDLHGGSIHFESEPGCGTTVTVNLPLE